MKSLIIVKDNDLYVGTWNLSRGFGVDHRYLKKTVQRYKSEFEEFGVSVSYNVNSSSKKGGRPIEEYLLNEEQATYLTMLMKNTPKVREFKQFLNKEFFRQRKLIYRLLVSQENQEWNEKREAGKLDRRVETDAIKEFVTYAKQQGSENADRYYLVLTKMENSSMFHLDFLETKFPNLRDVLNGTGLNSLQSADRIIARALKEGMELGMLYKEIFLLARQRVELFSEIIGKTPLSTVLNVDYKILN